MKSREGERFVRHREGESRRRSRNEENDLLECWWWLEKVEARVGICDCDETRCGYDGFPVCFIKCYTLSIYVHNDQTP